MRESLTEQEWLHRAFHSSDLSLRPGKRGHADHLIALGLAGRAAGGPAAALMRANPASTPTELRAALRSAMVLAKRVSAKRGWRLSGKTLLRVAEMALAHHIYPACLHCHGRGYETMPGAPALSDRACPHCGGSGRRPVQKRWRSEITELIAVFERIDSVAAAAVAKRMK